MTVAPLCRRMAAALAALAVSVTAAGAQTTTGVIDGTIRDPDGQIVPGVQVVLSSAALIERERTVFSNAVGYYRVPALPPGLYTVTYALDGFQTVERAGLIVNAGQTTSVDVALHVAAVAEAVTVIGESPTVDPTSAKLGFNFTQQLLENMPTARTFHDLASTIPGVAETNIYGTAPGNLKNESVLGAGPFGNFYMVDGYNATDPTITYNQNSLFSYDAIEEVHVLRGAKPAEVGFAQGGFFHVITKSGGNDLSGVGSVYYQDEELQSDNLDDRLQQAGVRRSDRLIDGYDASVSPGGRFIRDRLWWFGSARRERRTFQLLGYQGDVVEKINALFWKNTLQVKPGHRVVGILNRWDQRVDPFFFVIPPSLAEDHRAAGRQHDAGGAWHVRWQGTLRDDLLVDVGAGRNMFRLDIEHHPDSSVAVIDLVTGRRFNNPGFFSRDEPSYNSNVDASLSWFVPEAAGRHDFKIGSQFTRGSMTWGVDEIQDHRLALSNGSPFRVTIINTPVDAAWAQDYLSLYAQDSWTIRDRLTLNLGVRYDRIKAMLPEQSSGGGQFADTYHADRFPQLKRQTFPDRDLWDWNSVAPRLAASYKLDSAGKTVLKGGYARYYHHLNSQQVWSVNPNFPFSINYRWTDLNGDRQYQLGEEGALLSVSGGGLTDYDRNLKHPYSDEVTFGVSRELLKDFSLNASFVYRTDRDLMYSINTGVPFSAFRPTAATDPGEDGRIRTADDSVVTVFAQDPSTFGRDRFLLTNPGERGFDSGRVYRGFEILANKRFSNRWQFVGSLVVSEMDVVVPTSEAGGATGSIFQNPNNLINVRGRDTLNQTYLAKLQGTYTAPYGIVLSALHKYGSGSPFTRELVVLGLPQGPITVFAEPRGSRETDSYHWIDFRAEKSFVLPGRSRLGVMFDVFNLTNASTVLRMGSRTAVDLGVPRTVVNPRIARIGVRMTW